MSKFVITKVRNPHTEIVTYRILLDVQYADSSFDVIPESFIADKLAGMLLREVNSYDGYEIVEKEYEERVPSDTEKLTTLLQAYIQKYGPLE